MVTEAFGIGLQKDIRRGWDEFNLRTSILERNRLRTKFWLDRWVGECFLKVAFLTHFKIAYAKDTRAADWWEVGAGGVPWCLGFQRNFHVSEMEEVGMFMGLIHDMMYGEGEDNLFWKEGKRQVGREGGVGHVKSYFNSLCMTNSEHFPVKKAWGTFAP